eukprot:scaffold78477_cov66-Phaeocystis_antarctica.AAC.2
MHGQLAASHTRMWGRGRGRQHTMGRVHVAGGACACGPRVSFGSGAAAHPGPCARMKGSSA